jgi:hypothetical protein
LQNIQECNNSGQIWDRLAQAPFIFKCHKQGMNSILLMARSNKQIAGACHGNIALFGKVAHSGMSPSKLKANLPSLAKSPFVAKWSCWQHCLPWQSPCWNHHQYSLVSLPVMLVLSPCCMCIAASISLPLLQWPHCLCSAGVGPFCSNGACPIMTPLAIHCNTLHHQLPFSPHCRPWQICPQMQRDPSWRMAFLGEVTILGKVAILASLLSWQPCCHGDFAVLSKFSSSAMMLSCYSPFLWQGHLF